MAFHLVVGNSRRKGCDQFNLEAKKSNGNGGKEIRHSDGLNCDETISNNRKNRREREKKTFMLMALERERKEMREKWMVPFVILLYPRRMLFTCHQFIK